MIRGDFHTHSNFSDGKNTPEEMVQSAIRMGLTHYGLSDHSHTYFDPGYCMSTDSIPAYVRIVRGLIDKYSDDIKLYCGIEQDIFSDIDHSLFDYVIGSVHYVEKEGHYISIDNKPEVLSEGAKRYYNGDIYQLVRDYYHNVSRVVDITGCDIIGHFDLITKFIEVSDILDVHDARYVEAWRYAADHLIPYGIPFEINTGAISRGYRTSPYPAIEIYDYLRTRGAEFVLSSDSHSAESIAFQFDLWLKRYKDNIIEFK